MKKLKFISRLNLLQLYEFLEKQFPNTNFILSLDYEKNTLTVVTSNSSTSDEEIELTEKNSYIFKDYESSDKNAEKSWIKFLYSVFGEEYKKAYLKMCEKKLFNN